MGSGYWGLPTGPTGQVRQALGTLGLAQNPHLEAGRSLMGGHTVTYETSSNHLKHGGTGGLQHLWDTGM